MLKLNRITSIAAAGGIIDLNYRIVSCLMFYFHPSRWLVNFLLAPHYIFHADDIPRHCALDCLT